METVQVFIGLGSNLENPAEQIHLALGSLKALAINHRISASMLYRSRPMGPADQPDYINAAAAFECVLSPRQLLQQLQSIELKQGRVRNGERWGPRTLDLDILLYGQHVINEPDLTIPHPGIPHRSFVLLPLRDIAPQLAIPEMGALADLVESINQDDIERLQG